MNYADILIVFFVLLFAFSGYFRGAILQFLDFLTLLVAVVISVKFYAPFARYLESGQGVNPNLAKVLSFFILWVGAQLVFNIAIHFLYPLIPEKIRSSKINRYAGALPGILWGIVFIAFFVSLLSIFPVNSNFKDAVVSSKTGSYIISQTANAEKYLSKIMGGAVNDTLTFLTVRPNSGETVDLGFRTTQVTIDSAAEDKMLELVNAERKKKGLKPLVMDEKLRELARAHSRDMFARGYFAHVNPDGLDPFQRMKEFGIKFMVAGENLALAPSVDLAHQGLMNSPGHRANILNPDFGKVGIGCIDGGPYGKMFSQEFTN